MWTCNGKQNSRVLWGLTVNGTGTVPTGDSTQLTVTTDPTGLDQSDITWASSDELIATVDTAGLVTGVAPGTVTITADVNGITGSLEVVVS